MCAYLPHTLTSCTGRCSAGHSRAPQAGDASSPTRGWADRGPGGAPSDGDQRLFVACAAGKEEVIRAVLSVYVRRGRLPEPGELMFCTDSTSDEDLELAVRRFVDRRHMPRQGRVPAPASGGVERVGESGGGSGGDSVESGVHVIADVHRLSYTAQAALRDHIRSLVLDCSSGDGDGGGGGGSDGAT